MLCFKSAVMKTSGRSLLSLFLITLGGLLSIYIILREIHDLSAIAVAVAFIAPFLFFLFLCIGMFSGYKQLKPRFWQTGFAICIFYMVLFWLPFGLIPYGLLFESSTGYIGSLASSPYYLDILIRISLASFSVDVFGFLVLAAICVWGWISTKRTVASP